MENKYLVSIIVPVHNTADYLHKCIESLRSQTLQQIEIILVDNLSVDGSSDLFLWVSTCHFVNSQL